MSEKTIENDFDKAVEFIVESDFNKNLNKCLDIVKELDKKDKEIERLNNIIEEVRDTLEKYRYTKVEEYEKIVEFYKKIESILNKGE